MPFIIKEEQREIQLPSTDTHQAVCYNVWNLGVQKTEFQGKVLFKNQAMIGWELAETIPRGDFAGKRFVQTKRYTASLFKKSNLGKDLAAWLGRELTAEEINGGFDLEEMVGKNCLLSIIHVPKKSDPTKMTAKIGAIIKPHALMPLMVPENHRTTPKWIEEIMNGAIDPDLAEEMSKHGADEPPF